jgi:predicted NBD/HSP70 family sugar kinase
LSLDKNHRVFRKNRGVFKFVESLDRLLREVAEKIAGTQIAIKTAFNAAQAGHAHGRSFISSISQKRACVGWRAAIDTHQ